ncbi:MAG: hypothetical protein KA184_17820 [Candidatus Hydrogenedentes bacterium]|nr:hypothetical protein [Candidatus Hydrogenedentota bacterium]
MFRVRRDPIWLLFLMAPLLAAAWVLDPASRGFYIWCVVGLGVFLVLRIAFWLLKKASGTPVPDSAVLELLDRSKNAPHSAEWVLTRFRPAVPLEAARAKVGSAEYTDEDRVRGFMMKAELIAPSRPDVAVFYSPNKGILLGNPEMIRNLEKQYGRWLLDTWYCLTGAMSRVGMASLDLDGPQTLVHGRHVEFR